MKMIQGHTLQDIQHPITTAALFLLQSHNYLERVHAVEEGAMVVRWLTGQRNSHGGFISTQVSIRI